MVTTNRSFDILVDNVVKGSLEFVPGTTYQLDVSSIDTQYFGLSTTPDGTWGGGDEFDDDTIVLRDFDNGVITIHASETVPYLYYYDTDEAGHGGSITTPIVLEMTWQSITDGNKYFVNGEQQPFIEFEPGKLYKFDVSDIGGHPLAFSTTVDGTHNTTDGGVKYTGDELSTDADGNILLLADADTPVLHYYCELHSGMGWEPSAPYKAAPGDSMVEGDFDVYVATDASGEPTSTTVDQIAPWWHETQTTEFSIDQHPTAGDVIHYTNMNFQGIHLHDPDITSKASMSLSLWSETAGSMKVSLVSGAWPNSQESGTVIDVTAGEWNVISIDTAVFEGMDRTAVNQIKFDSQPAAIGDAAPLTDFFMDNVYFGNDTPTVLAPVDAEPETAAPAPGIDADDQAVFIDVASDMVENLNPGWGQAGSLAAVNLGDAVGDVLKVSDLNYQGIVFHSTDLSGMGSVHLDIWSEDAGKVKVFLISEAGTSDAVEVGTVIELTQAGDWNSFDIPLSSFPGVNLGSVNQMKLDSTASAVGDSTGLDTLYIDNLYFAASTDNSGGDGDGDGGGTTPQTTDYDHTLVYHNDSEAETASAVYMTIEKTGDDRITVTVESADTDPVDRVVIGAQAGDPTGYGGLTAMELTDGVASIDLFWGAAQMPDTHSFIVEWSKVSAPGDGGAGNWALTQEQLGTIDDRYQLRRVHR